MSRNEVLRALADGVDGTTLGKLAHRILDWADIDGQIWVKTPRNDWHRATDRELKIIREYRPKQGKHKRTLRRKLDRDTTQQPGGGWVVEHEGRLQPIRKKKQERRADPAQTKLDLWS
jgi:hypothetical protein